MSAVLVWFRRDLRLADNPAFAAAVDSGQPIVAVYLHAPEEEGAWAPGAASRWWLHHSLVALDRSLRALGGRLIVRREGSLAGLQRLIGETGANRVLWNRCYEPALIARDAAIKAALARDGIEARSCNAACLVEPFDIATQAGTPFKVFTPYWKRLRERVGEVEPVVAPRSVRFVPGALAGTATDELGLLPRIRWDAGMAATWRPGEAGARERLEDFLDAAADYAAERDRPDLPGTSMLSPHLHFGEISPRQIVARLHAAGGERGDPGYAERCEAYVRELAWREFSIHLLYHFPDSTDANLNRGFEQFDWADPDPGLLAAWQHGQTGIPMVDAGMRELWTTGWMHNRVRMVVASLLTKNLRYHWLHGARWFWDTLVDADLANNTQGWQWTAGTGADASPYFRIFNPVAQGERFDPDGAYVRRHIPELARVPSKFIHAPWTLRPSEQSVLGIAGTPYARPVVDLATTRVAALAAYKLR